PAQRQEQGAILGRIIARAVTANANPAANLAQAAVAPATAAGNSKDGAVPGAARASLENLVAAIVQSAGNQQGNASGNAGGNPNSFEWTQGRNALGPSNSSIAQSADRGSFAAQASALLATAWAPVASANGASAVPLGPPIPYTTVDAGSVIEQVIKGMQIKTFGADRSEVRMRLSPEHLGDVCVKLSMNGGNVSASITAQNADVRDTLLANQNALTKSLADAGLKLQNFSVNVSGGGPDGFAQHQDLARQAGSRRIAYRVGESDEAQNDVLAATPTFGPPLAAIQSLHLLNYLA
ncbi:MAG: flagellar hook-length control protein FliK, partial [Candidatus Eremiobacteraeota bacterium]|nr:flagellar hook-length control protein FliK [Candidatus Eremiobacteraeota bacterium]